MSKPKRVVKYVADDGTMFDTEAECVEYQIAVMVKTRLNTAKSCTEFKRCLHLGEVELYQARAICNFIRANIDVVRLIESIREDV